MSTTEIGSPKSPNAPEEHLLTQEEVLEFYEQIRVWLFEQFDNSCMQLVECLTSMIRESGKLDYLPQKGKDPVLELADAVKDSDLLEPEKASVVRRDAFSKLLGTDEEAAKYLARIPQPTIDQTNASLTAQLCAIQAAALSYVWSGDNRHRMLFENNLVRAGAELRDRLMDRPSGLLSSDSPNELRGIALDFVAIYERLLSAYDLLVAVQKEEGQLQRIEAKKLELARMESPDFSWSGLRSRLAGYLRFSDEDFLSLFRLTENKDSFEDLWTNPFPAATWEILDRGAGWSAGLSPAGDSRSLLRDLFSKYYLTPVEQLDRARRVLAREAFPDEPHPQSPSPLRSVGATVEFDQADDTKLLKRALMRSISDPGRCGWLGVLALRIGRQRTAWPGRNGYRLKKDPALNELFDLGKKLYEKLCPLDYHFSALDIRMSLLWELVYDPQLLPTEENPYALKETVKPVSEWLKDARDHLAALLSNRLRSVGATDIQHLTNNLSMVWRYRCFSTALKPEFKQQGPGSNSENFKSVSALISKLADADKLERDVFVTPGSFTNTRASDLENVLSEALPPADNFIVGWEQSLRRLAALPLQSVRAHLQLWKLWPEIVEAVKTEPKADDKTIDRKILQHLDALFAGSDVAEDRNPRLQMLKQLLTSPVPETIKLGGIYTCADDWRRAHWYRRLFGLETCCIAIADERGEQSKFREVTAFRIPEDLRFVPEDRRDRDGQAEDKIVPQDLPDLGPWFTPSPEVAKSFNLSLLRTELIDNEKRREDVIKTEDWRSRLDSFGRRIFGEGRTSRDGPFFIVSDMEISLTLIAWALLQALRRGGHDLHSVSAWLKGNGKLTCLPGIDESGTLKLQELTIGEFLTDMGLQDQGGIPTERLHSLVDFAYVEVFCRKRAGVTESYDVMPHISLDDWKSAAELPRNLWYREVATNINSGVSECGRAAIEALWELIGQRLPTQSTAEEIRRKAEDIAQELERSCPIVDLTEEFWYRRSRQVPIANVVLPLVQPKLSSESRLPRAFAVFRISGIFLTREYRRRAIGNEFGDWFRFGNTASATYRLAAERLVAIQRFLNALIPFFEDTNT